ncbi:zinc-dependent peptidase [Ramlibacter sp. H39-3-26]|uniref:M90 family metallopeptidase n=1 Tax=Curvibacter soli TaxID=3031331 RepID=UPI0023D9A99E|nr:M90 family metallopeptidase [Ramlibacter sp. H39-3-26]MDF1485290.1 zinc-dependent peptidase [Ramlibacter sp. H39-3-26]
MAGFWNWLARKRVALPGAQRAIPAAAWDATLARYPFLQALTPYERARLQVLCGLFLARKEFTGAGGLAVSDAMALDIAAQACLPLLHIGPPEQALAWYGDFVGIVVHPGEVVAQREVVDDAGVVHRYDEVLSGEAMERGPVMLSWQDVAAAQAGAYNVVIHEFTHKIDMRGGVADGCPPLPTGFLGTAHARAARQAWMAVLEPAYARFREQAIIAERFSGPATWLDPYGAESPAEFFAVACEAYFVARARFTEEFPTLAPLFDAFFRREA